MIIEKNSIKISAIIAIIMFVIIVLNFGEFSFWYDEFCTIGFIRNGRSLSDLIRIFVTDEVSNPPLYTLFLYIWYRLFPHTQSALLFPNLLFYCLGTFFLLKTLVRDTGVKISVLICSIFCLVNSFAVKYQIYELRSYAMLFMFSSMVLSSYCKCRSDRNRFNMMLFSISTLLCSMTHYFGLLAVSGFGFFELVLAIKDKDKAKLRNLFVYIPTGIISVFWLAICMIYKTRDIRVFWKGRPGLKDIAGVLNCFYGRNYLYFLIMVLMFTYCIYRVIKGKDSIVEYKKTFISFWVAGYVFAGVLIYSYFINPKGSIFVARYFIAIIPELVYIFSYLLTKICVKLKNERKSEKLEIIIIMILLAAGIIGGYEGFREAIGFETDEGKAAKIILEHCSDDGKNIAFISPDINYSYNGIGYAFDGWRELYFGEKPYNIVEKNELENLKYYEYDKIILVGSETYDANELDKSGYRLESVENINLNILGFPYDEIYFYELGTKRENPK